MKNAQAAPADATTEPAHEEKRRLSLYEITEELAALDELLEETEGEVTPEIEAWMEEFGPMLMRKVDSIGRYCTSLTAAAAACKAEEARLAKRREVLEEKVAGLRRLLEMAMSRRGASRLEGQVFTARRQKNGGRPALAVAVRPEELPHWLTRTVPATVTADNEAIREAIKAIEAAGGEDPDSTLCVSVQEDGARVLYNRPEPEGAEMELARIAGPTYSVRIG